MIAQTEELYRIEMNKKALVKNDYDEVAQRTSANFSQEAMKLSMAKLNELESRIKVTYER